MRATDRAEIRISGPYARECTRGHFLLDVFVSVLLTSRYDGDAKNAYQLLNNVGAFQEAMGAPVSIWNFGSKDGDYREGQPETLQLIGCMKLQKGVRVTHYGQTDVTDKIKQAEVEARYVLELHEGQP